MLILSRGTATSEWIDLRQLALALSPGLVSICVTRLMKVSFCDDKETMDKLPSVLLRQVFELVGGAVRDVLVAFGCANRALHEMSKSHACWPCVMVPHLRHWGHLSSRQISTFRQAESMTLVCDQVARQWFVSVLGGTESMRLRTLCLPSVLENDWWSDTETWLPRSITKLSICLSGHKSTWAPVFGRLADLCGNLKELRLLGGSRCPLFEYPPWVDQHLRPPPATDARLRIKPVWMVLAASASTVHNVVVFEPSLRVLIERDVIVHLGETALLRRCTKADDDKEKNVVAVHVRPRVPYLGVGDLVDVCDPTNVWHTAIVLRHSSDGHDNVLVHYISWSRYFDEWIHRSGGFARFASPWTRSRQAQERRPRSTEAALTVEQLISYSAAFGLPL